MTATTATLGRHRADRRKNGSHMGAADEQEMMGQTVCNILQIFVEERERDVKRGWTSSPLMPRVSDISFWWVRLSPPYCAAYKP